VEVADLMLHSARGQTRRGNEKGVMRRPVIAGNWKMFKTQAETRAYFAAA